MPQAFYNDSSADRAALVARLNQEQLPALEMHASGGEHVILPLVIFRRQGFQVNAVDPTMAQSIQSIFNNHYSHSPHLVIATRSRKTSSEIGIQGEDPAGNAVAVPDWERTVLLDEALVIIRRLWDKRDEWLKKWLDGKIMKVDY